jgi:hypothetical protein
MGVGRKAIKRRLLEMENVDIMDTSITYREETDQMSYDSWRVEENFSGLSEDLVPA